MDEKGVSKEKNWRTYTGHTEPIIANKMDEHYIGRTTNSLEWKMFKKCMDMLGMLCQSVMN